MQWQYGGFLFQCHPLNIFRNNLAQNFQNNLRFTRKIRSNFVQDG